MQLVQSVRSVLQHKTPGALWSVSSWTSVYDALALMSSRDIGALLVIDHGDLVGIFSERDYARKIVLLGRSSRETEVREIMSSPPLTVTPDHTVDDCMNLMTTHRIRHLPVMENDRIAGMLSIGDLVNWIISSHEQTINQLHHYIAGSYPA
jgi:CBS domain-containing protein